GLVRRLVLVGTGPRGGDAIARQAPEVAPLFTRRDELGEDMWLPIMFSPSKESQAAGRAFVSRITARAQDRDVPVSDQTIAAYRAAARGWASAPADNFGYLDGIAQPALVVNGSSDIVIPTINSYHLYQHLPDAELMLLPDSGHGAHFQYVDGFVRRYREDEATRQQVRPGTVRRIWPYLRRYRAKMVLLLGITAVESAILV